MFTKLKGWWDWSIRVHWLAIILVSVGTSGMAVKVLQAFIHLDWQWQVLIWLTLAGLLSFTLSWAMSPKKKWDGQQNLLPQTEIGLIANEPTFNVDVFLKNLYQSPLEVGFELGIRGWLDKLPGKQREESLIMLARRGLVSYVYELAWWLIFGSQMAALTELNNRVIRKEEIKLKYYDKAIPQDPKFYAKYPFEQWLNYLKFHVFILELPGNTIGITERGRDFLKYLVHVGYNPNQKRL
jgi:hypothetical protein